MKQILTKQKVGDMLLLYLYDTNSDKIGLSIVPESLEDEITLEGDWNIESLIQLRLVGDSHLRRFSHGMMPRNSFATRELRFREQYIEREMGVKTIVTVLENQKVIAYHRVRYYEDAKTITVTTEIKNRFINPITIERISSVSICGWPMYSTDAYTDDMKLYRMRNKRNANGKIQKGTFMDIELEPSWSRYGVQSICYGQVESRPAKEYFPWGVIEDQKYGVCLGTMIAHSDSWQIEVYNSDDRCAIFGGLRNQEGAHWKKTLANGESFVTPEAILSVVASDVESVSNRLVQGIQESSKQSFFMDETMPILFHKSCAGFEKPAEEKIEGMLSALQGKGIEYFVIDASWYAKKI